jgi:hypothetical protein
MDIEDRLEIAWRLSIAEREDRLLRVIHKQSCECDKNPNNAGKPLSLLKIIFDHRTATKRTMKFKCLNCGRTNEVYK